LQFLSQSRSSPNSREPNVQCRVHKSPQPIPILRSRPPSYLYQIHFNITLTSNNRSYKWFILSFPTKAQYVYFSSSVHATIPPKQTAEHYNALRTYSLRTDTSPGTPTVCQHNAQKDTSQRPHQAGFTADLQTGSNSLKAPPNPHRSSDTTNLKITVRQCLLPFRRSARTLALLFAKNSIITTYRSCNWPVLPVTFICRELHESPLTRRVGGRT
jgi:hypothetical protein